MERAARPRQTRREQVPARSTKPVGPRGTRPQARVQGVPRRQTPRPPRGGKSGGGLAPPRWLP
jgi:hypothetical protein